jgi:hypothetical protein
MLRTEGEWGSVKVPLSQEVAALVLKVAEREKLPQSRIATAMLRQAVVDESETLDKLVRAVVTYLGKLTGQAREVGERPKSEGYRLQLARVPLEILAGVDRIAQGFGLSREETCGLLITGIIRDTAWVDDIVSRWLRPEMRDVVYEGQRRAPKRKRTKG